VIKTADWVIDIGPEAGAEGGYVVASGTPEEIVAAVRSPKPRSRTGRRKSTGGKATGAGKSTILSHTAVALAPILDAGPHKERKRYEPDVAEAPRKEDIDIDQLGRDAKMPWEVNGRQ